MSELVFPNGLSDIADRYDAILCDVWGVIHNGREAFYEACDALAEFRKTGKPVILITNAPVQAREVERLFPGLGVRRDCYNLIVSSGDATRMELEKRAPGPALRLGLDNSWERDNTLFDGAGLEFAEAEKARFVVAMGLRDAVNDDPEDYRVELKPLVEAGLTMICANPDIQVRVGNTLQWCAGAIAKIYEEEGGEVVYPGKPHDAIYDLAESHLERLLGDVVPKTGLLAIGDGPATDMRGAMNRGIDSVYVGTGLNLAGTGDFQTDTKALLERYEVSATYAMSGLRW